MMQTGLGNFTDCNMKKIAIIGFGIEGRGVLKFLLKHPAHANDEIWVLDRNPVSVPYAARRRARVRVRVGPKYLHKLSSFDVIFKSPGVSIHLAQIKRAVKHGARLTSSLDLFFEHAKGTTIGITGTKGKGTTATLLHKMLKRCGKDAYLGGNIGSSPLDIAEKLTPRSVTVLELSSFQLQNLNFSPQIAVSLDVFKDHLDVHKNFWEYILAKSKIVKHQKRDGTAFYFADNQLSRRVAEKSRGEKISVSEKDWKIFSKNDLKIPGIHNFKNAVMAGAVARYLGCGPASIRAAAREFKGLPHRLELCKTVRAGGRTIRIFNDSASTNPDAAAAALRTFREPKVLIIGGKNKNLDYSPVARAISTARVELVVLFGENRNEIARSLSRSRVPMVVVSSLASALKTAKNHLTRTSEDSVVLFSPASTSFDMFKNYNDRGEAFKKLARTFFSQYARPSRKRLR